MEIPGFQLLLQDFCSYCPDFKADVESVESNVFSYVVPRYMHTIRCAHAKRCARIAKNIEKQVMSSAEDKRPI